MAAWQWSYPYNDTDSATVYFTATAGKSATTGCQWRVPLVDNPQPQQVVTTTMTGVTTGYELGSPTRTIILKFNALPEGSAATATDLWGYLGIKEFLATHTTHAVSSFGFYDHAGSAEAEVRYISGIESFQRGAGGYYTGTITLKG